MKQVTRYECPFCKKLFKTADRHKCKRDPKLKNCFSCANWDGFEFTEAQIGDDGRREIAADTMPKCAVWESMNLYDHFEADIDAAYVPDWTGDPGNYNFVNVMYQKGWNLQCPGWRAKEAC